MPAERLLGGTLDRPLHRGAWETRTCTGQWWRQSHGAAGERSRRKHMAQGRVRGRCSVNVSTHCATCSLKFPNKYHLQNSTIAVSPALLETPEDPLSTADLSPRVTCNLPGDWWLLAVYRELGWCFGILCWQIFLPKNRWDF